MAYGDKPFGLREVVLKRGSLVAALPVSQTLMFGDEVVTGRLSGDDRLAAITTFPTNGKWSLEAGGISLAAYKVMTGRDATETGSSPNRVTEMAAQARVQYPYFTIFGRSLGDGDDDLLVKIPYAKITVAPSGELKLDEYYITKCEGLAIDYDGNGFYILRQRETAADVDTDND